MVGVGWGERGWGGGCLAVGVGDVTRHEAEGCRREDGQAVRRDQSKERRSPCCIFYLQDARGELPHLH